jgi:hypothetical protein
MRMMLAGAFRDLKPHSKARNVIIGQWTFTVVSTVSPYSATLDDGSQLDSQRCRSED